MWILCTMVVKFPETSPSATLVSGVYEKLVMPVVEFTEGGFAPPSGPLVIVKWADAGRGLGQDAGIDVFGAFSTASLAL